MSRYVVGAAHYCGNTWELSGHDTLCAAQSAANAVRVSGRFPAVFITDTNDPERGDLSDADIEDEIERTLRAPRNGWKEQP